MEKGPGKQTACGELKKKGAQFIFRRKQFHAPRGHDASTDVAIPGRDGRGEQSEARTGNRAPVGRP